MKVFILTLLMSLNAFGSEICRFTDTAQFDDAVEKGEYRFVKRTNKFTALTNIEKQLLMHMMSAYFAPEKPKLTEAVRDFERSEGSINYYTKGSKSYVVVHFYPGDNEVGTIFEITRNHRFKAIAVIGDGEISCN